jgi:predicted double-glycine peptidase
MIALALVHGPASLGEDGTSRTPLRDRQHTVSKHVRTWQEMRHRNIVMQQRDFSCGAAAIATVLQYYWGETVSEDAILRTFDGLLTLEEVRDRVEHGLSLTDLRRAAVKLGYLATIGEISFDRLAESEIPLVVGIKVQDYDHFVVYRGTDQYFVYLADPARGNLRVPVPQFLQQWQKNLVLVIVKQGAGKNLDSPLLVQPAERRLGALNDHVVRQLYAKPPRLFPLAKRP